MEAEGWFKLFNRGALVFWILLCAFPRNRLVTTFVVPVGAVCILGCAYVYFLTGGLGSAPDFGSLAAIRAIFQDDRALLAGWIHYLAFDLFMGCWIVNDAVRNKINHATVVPSLFLTLMFGPVGYVAYILIRTVIYKKPLSV